MIMLLNSHRLQPVTTSCTTAVAHYENPATATEKSSCYQLGSVGLHFFAVAATGPQKTNQEAATREGDVPPDDTCSMPTSICS